MPDQHEDLGDIPPGDLRRFAQCMGRLGGLAGGPIGGKSRSEAKVSAARKNCEKARAIKAEKKQKK